MDEELQRDYLSKAAFAPPEILGTHLGAVIINMVISFYAVALTGNLGMALIFVPFHLVCVAISSRDPHGFRLLGLHLLTTLRTLPNRLFWRGSSVSPATFDRKRLPKGPLRNKIQAEAPGSSYIPYTAHVSPEIIRTKNGEYITVFAIDGVSFAMEDDAQLNAWHSELDLFLRSINDPRITIYRHNDHRRINPAFPGRVDDSFAGNVVRLYREHLDGQDLFVTDQYLTLVYQPNPGLIDRTLGKADRITPQHDRKATEEAIREVDRLARDWLQKFERYGIRRLTCYEHKGIHFSQALEFLYYLANGERRRVPLLRTNLQNVLLTTRPVFHRQTIELRSPEQTVLAAILNFKEPPEQTRPGQLNDLLSAQYEYVLAQSYSCLSKDQAKRRLRLVRKQHEDVEPDSQGLTGDLSQMIQGLVSDRYTTGVYHMTLMVKGENVDALNRNISAARSDLEDAGALATREDLGMESSYWAQLPGNMAWRTRIGPIRSPNFAGLAALHNYPRGKAKGNHWGDAVTVLKTTANTPYYFNFHRGQIATTLVIGTAGEGKTATVNLLASHLLTRGVYGVWLDIDNSNENFIYANGGHYVTLQDGEPTGWNPFDHDDSEAWRLTVRKLVLSCITRPDRSPSTQDEHEITEAVDTVFRLPRGQRRFGNLMEVLPPPQDDNAAARLMKWCDSKHGRGALAWVFDNPVETMLFDQDQRLFGFDYTSLVNNPEICGPAVLYLLTRISELTDRGRMFLAISEYWQALGAPVLHDFLNKSYRTQRKYDWFIIADTQNPEDALSSEISKVLIQMTPTILFLPNRTAKRQDYVDGYGLTEQAYLRLKSEFPEGSRKVLIKHGTEIVACDLRLPASFRDAFSILSPTKDEIRLGRQVRADVGPSPSNWLPEFYRRRAHESHR